MHVHDDDDDVGKKDWAILRFPFHSAFLTPTQELQYTVSFSEYTRSLVNLRFFSSSKRHDEEREVWEGGEGRLLLNAWKRQVKVLLTLFCLYSLLPALIFITMSFTWFSFFPSSFSLLFNLYRPVIWLPSTEDNLNRLHDFLFIVIISVWRSWKEKTLKPLNSSSRNEFFFSIIFSVTFIVCVNNTCCLIWSEKIVWRGWKTSEDKEDKREEDDLEWKYLKTNTFCPYLVTTMSSSGFICITSKQHFKSWWRRRELHQRYFSDSSVRIDSQSWRDHHDVTIRLQSNYQWVANRRPIDVTAS